MAEDSHGSSMASIQRSDTPAWLGKVGQVLGDGLERSQPAQRLDIPGETLAANHRDAGAGRHGVAAEFLALADVGDVHLDGGARGDALQGVVQGDAGVGVGAEVDDESLGAAVGERVDAVDERALVVGLEEADRHAELPGLGADESLKVLERGRAVDLRLALAEPVEIGTVKDGDFFHEDETTEHTEYTEGSDREIFLRGAPASAAARIVRRT